MDYKTQITNNEIKNTLFPIGTVLTTATSTNPGTTLGGTWTLISKDTLLRTMKSDLAVTGGSTTYTLQTSNLPNHTHSLVAMSTASPTISSNDAHNHSVTFSSVASHTHSISGGSAGNHSHTLTVYYKAEQKGGSALKRWRTDGAKTATDGVAKITSGSVGHSHTWTIGNTHSNHSHTVTLADAGIHAHAITFSTKNTTSTGTSTSINIVPLHARLYIWERTA